MRKRTGATLIEILVVIVVFLVGILALVQLFPPGFNALRIGRGVEIANQLSRSEMDRLQSSTGELAYYIAPVEYQNVAGALRIIIDPNRLRSDLMPDKDPDPNPGLIAQNGEVIVGGNPLGQWYRVSGSNLVSRVIDEEHPVPAPTQVSGVHYGGVLDLMFAPIYYFRDTNTTVGVPGVLTLYGNDMVRRRGNRDRGIPFATGRVRSDQFYYVYADDAQNNTPFPGEDQIWLGPLTPRQVRIQFSFGYDDGSGVALYDMIAVVDLGALPPYVAIEGNYYVISLNQLVGEPDIYGNQLYSAANYVGMVGESVAAQKVYQEIPLAAGFTDPYQYKVINDEMGTILVSPSAATRRERNRFGERVPLVARADYTVYDWRILRDAFRVPNSGTFNQKLLLASLKVEGELDTDGSSYQGFELAVPHAAQSDTTTVGFDDTGFVLQDVATGGFILGDAPNSSVNSFIVDKSTGAIQFIDVDGVWDLSMGNGLSAYVARPGDAAPTFLPDIRGRAVRAHYMAKGDFAVQAFKPASSYRITNWAPANGVTIGSVYVGGSNANGDGAPFRLYFPLADLGYKVVVSEVWYDSGGGPEVLRDQEFQISGVENLGGRDMAFADIRSHAPAGSVFDYSNGYTVRGVRGASLLVRVLWNPSSWRLTSDEVLNYERLGIWMQQMKISETESFQMGGNNR